MLIFIEMKLVNLWLVIDVVLFVLMYKMRTNVLCLPLIHNKKKLIVFL